MNNLLEKLRSKLADLGNWYSRLTQRERRLVGLASGGGAFFILFILFISFSTSASRYQRNTREKLLKYTEIQTLAESYRDAETVRQNIERDLTASNISLISYIEEKASAAGVTVSSTTPKAEVSLGDGKIIEKPVEVLLTDIPLAKLVSFLQMLENSPSGMVKVTNLRVEPRLQTQTLSANAIVSTYQMKK